MKLFITTIEILKLIDKNPHDFRNFVLFFFFFFFFFLSENGLFGM